MRGAPRQLLARELWAGSGSAPDWLRRQRCYSATTAVMSMVRSPVLVVRQLAAIPCSSCPCTWCCGSAARWT